MIIINENELNVIATNGYIPIIDIIHGIDNFIVAGLKIYNGKNVGKYEIHKHKLYYNAKRDDYYFKWVNGLRYYLSDFIRTNI